MSHSLSRIFLFVVFFLVSTQSRSNEIRCMAIGPMCEIGPAKQKKAELQEKIKETKLQLKALEDQLKSVENTIRTLEKELRKERRQQKDISQTEE